MPFCVNKTSLINNSRRIEGFLLASIQREIEMVRNMEMAQEIEIEGWREGETEMAEGS
jgi:hypothetical protein